jgi:hypothetical protein
VAAFTPATGTRYKYTQVGGEPTKLAGITTSGDRLEWQGLRWAAEGREEFTLDVPKDADLVLKKRYLLDAAGQQAEVLVNGQSLGKWDLRPADKQLSLGLREAAFFIQRKTLGGKSQATVEIRYSGPANTARWCVLECRETEFPLTALGPIHADQNVGQPRLARSVIGEKIKIGTTGYADGIGVMAKSLLEYPTAGQFNRFTATVGVDAATEGRGSVVFEVVCDGKRRWTSGLMSGLDQPKKIDIDVRGVGRLRLVVSDGGDGNKYDAADWCEPTLHR